MATYSGVLYVLPSALWERGNNKGVGNNNEPRTLGCLDALKLLCV